MGMKLADVPAAGGVLGIDGGTQDLMDQAGCVVLIVVGVKRLHRETVKHPCDQFPVKGCAFQAGFRQLTPACIIGGWKL